MMVPVRFMAAAIAALASGAAASPGHAQPPPVHSITCTNVASGATWQLGIDYAKATVDANPAQISDREIAWHDAKDGGNYTLDRKTGELTMVMPSSTGGYFRHDHCRLPP